MKELNWQDMFKRYANLVCDAEGTDFLEEKHWTAEEWRAITHLWSIHVV